MAVVVVLIGVAIFLSGIVAGIIGLVAVAVHREERAHTLTGAASDSITRAGRLLTGLYVRGLDPAPVDREKAAAKG